VAVTDDGQGVADELIALLQQAGVLAARWGEATGELGAVVFLGGLGSARDDVQVTREAFRIARTLAGRGSFVTVGRLGGAGPGALARTCAREWPGAAVRAIEVEYGHGDAGGNAAGIAAAVAAELLTGDTEPDVVLHADGGRTVWTMLPDPARPASRDAAVPGPESVVVITGGGRGVTAACAQALAGSFRPRIALIGRTVLTDEPPESRAARTEAELRSSLIAQALRSGGRPRPAVIEAELKRVLAVRDVRETLARIAAAGSPVRYLAADVADTESLGAALDEVRAEWGPITTVVHGAGVLADRLTADKTDEQFEHVMRVKATGFQNLLDLVGDDDPASVCVFSSVVVSAGNAGQCDYAAANEIAERIALDWRAARPDCLVKAIAWGPWHGGMVTADLAAAFGERDIPLIPLAGGASAFVAELAGPADDQVRCLITAGGGAGVSRGGEIEVSEVSQAWLADHRVGGRAVVPLAVACDWMLRLVDAPGPVVLRDIDVVRGVTAPAVVTVRRTGSALTVASGGGQLCYRASLGAEDAAASPPAFEPIGRLPVHDGPIYDGETLFHGPALQVLRRIEGLGPAGAIGEVAGAGGTRESRETQGTDWSDEPWRTDPAAVAGAGSTPEVQETQETDWPQDEPWRTDPAAVDGAIQLAVLWARERIGRATLPMSVRAARFRAAGPESGPLRCVVRAVSVGEQSAVCDVLLTRSDGETVAALDGLELVARPR
jgi:NAD(P)-dependent dehydrogenase (short-subunit alcohol dehydrogenase family)